MPSRKNALPFKLIFVLALAMPAALCQLNSNTASVALNATYGTVTPPLVIPTGA
jgi:hypothetical protein